MAKPLGALQKIQQVAEASYRETHAQVYQLMAPSIKVRTPSIATHQYRFELCHVGLCLRCTGAAVIVSRRLGCKVAPSLLQASQLGP
jgi:hypothetical protein